MAHHKFNFIFGIILGQLYLLNLVDCHAMLMEPVGRQSRWRVQSGAPVNYDDNNINCGGVHTQMGDDSGCGICGDYKGLSQPRPNELGGKFGQGNIVKMYMQNAVITVGTEITANHLGYVHYQICNLDKFHVESEECFAEYGQLNMTDGRTQFFVGSSYGRLNSYVVLPKNLYCAHCVFRWNYVAGNNWGVCPDGRGALGCGKQETYRNCADIMII